MNLSVVDVNGKNVEEIEYIKSFISKEIKKELFAINNTIINNIDS